MKYDLIVFDLDGTLLDTLGDLADACNAALAACGYAPRSLDEIRQFIGGGVTRLIRRALPGDAGDDAAQRVLARFKTVYMENVNVRTAPCPGMPGLLDALRSAGIRAAVNSNKVDAASRLLVEAHFPGKIDMVVGDQEGLPKKPSPEGVNRIMAALGVSPERTLYVGDGDADILTAQNAGIDMGWVSWGYRTREELSGLVIPRAFDTAEALGRFILED